MQPSMISQIWGSLLCLAFLALVQGGIIQTDLSPGVTTITTTPVAAGDTLVYSCATGPCTINITSGVMFDLADGAALELNDVTLTPEATSDAVRMSGASSVTLRRVVISSVSPSNSSIVHALSGSSAQISFSHVTSSGRTGGGNTIFCELATLCDISVVSHSSIGNVDVFMRGNGTANLMASISDSNFTTIAGTSTLAALFDAEDCNSTVTLTNNIVDTATTRFLRFVRVGSAAGSASLTMNNNKFKLNPTTGHAITFDKVVTTIVLNKNIVQQSTMASSYALFALTNTTKPSSYLADGNQFLTNSVPGGHLYISPSAVDVVIRNHYISGCTGLNAHGANFASVVGGSLLVENSTFYNSAHSSGSIGMFVFASSSSMTSITFRNSAFLSNRLVGFGGDPLISFKGMIITGTTILFENNRFEENIGLSQGACIVFGTPNVGSATFRGNTFNANRGTNGVFRITASAFVTLTFDNCTFSNNVGTSDVAVIYSDGANNATFYFTNSRFVNNHGAAAGVMTYRATGSGSIYFVNSYFANNIADTYGAVLQLQNGANPVYFINSTFENNSAQYGGVVSIAIPTQFSFVGQGEVIFSNNTASIAGGAFYIANAGRGFLFENMKFVSNSAPLGGAITVQGTMSNITVNSCTFTSNVASTMGGALHFNGAIPTVSNSVFTSNQAPKGSSIAVVSSGATVFGGLTFTNEQANAAPLWLEGGVGDLTASNLDFTANTGGAIYGTGTFLGSLSFTDIDVTENIDTDISSGVGDSIVTFGTFKGNVTFTNANFVENIVSTGSIIKFSGAGKLDLNNCKFTSNEGAILDANEEVDVTVTNSQFESNSALAGVDEDAIAMISVKEVSSLSIQSSSFADDDYNLFFDLKTTEPVSLSTVSLAARSFDVSLFNIDSTEVAFDDVNITIGDSDSLGTCFVLEKTASFTLAKTNVANCQSTKAPALLFASGKSQIHITDSTFVDTTASLSSAFQVTESSHLTVVGSSFTNVADGLFFISGTYAQATFEDTTVSQAVSTTSDATFFSITRGAQVSLTDVHVSDGESLSSGGCVVVDSGTLTWVGGSISGCTTTRQGAAISFSGKVTAEMRDLTFEDNSAFQGGAISVSQLYASNVTIVNSHFNGHEAENGGVLYMAVPTGNTVTFSGCSFDSNTATTFGGVLMGLDSAHVDFVGCTMTNNAAAFGGVGSLDWSSSVSISTSTLQNNTATSSGGLFYLDKSSGVSIASSSISGSTAETGNGGVIYMAQSNFLTVTNSNFSDNSAMIDGGAISSPFGSKCTASISDSSFTRCHTGDKGGAISFSQFSPASLILARNTFTSNTAAYGGALSNQNAVNTPNVDDDIFTDNSATVYGDDIYSPPAALTTDATSFHLLSGATLPSIKVTLRDNYGNEYVQPPPQFFFTFMSIEAVSNVTQEPYLSGSTSEQITNGHVSFSEIKAYALPGNYRIKLGPSVGNTFYTGPTYIVYIDLVIKACLSSEGNHQDLEDLGCEPVLCSGCPTEKGATCVAPGNCSCPATLEGLQCEYLKDSYDSITLSFSTLPTLPSGHSNAEISVEMRDYILAELAKSFHATKGLVVKFRSFVHSAARRRAGATFDFKYSLLLNNSPVEGEALEEYKATAITYFVEEHGLGNALESNVVTSAAAIVTYSDPVVIAVVVLTAIFLALTVVFAVISILKRNTPVIRSSSPLFCLLILLGVAFAYVTPFSYIGPQTTLSCAAPVVLGPLSFSIIFGNLLAKTFRIYRIFANKTMRTSSPTIFQLLGFSGAVLGLELLLVIIWLAVDPPVPVRMGPEGGRYWTCYSPLSSVMVPIIAAYDGVLLLFGVYLAFKTRNAFSAYKETQLIGFTIYTLSIVAVAILPVLYLIELPLLAQFTIRSFSILFVATVTMFLLFGNKIVVILLLPQQNTTEYFNNKNGSSSVKGGFMLRPTGRQPSLSTTGFDINDVKMTSQGWMMINENKPWSQWKNMYAVQTGEYFGFFENEDCSGHKGGLHPISQWVVERVQTEGHLQMKLTLGEHSCLAETPNPDDMEKWFNSLVKVAHANL